MFNFLKRGQEVENLATGTNSMRFLGDEPRVKPPLVKAEPAQNAPVVLIAETAPANQTVPTVLSAGKQEMPMAKRNIPSGLNEEQVPPQNMLSVLPQGMEQNTSLNMPNSLMFGSTGGNVEKVARNWSIMKTPVFQFVQNQPIMRRSRITNRIGQVASKGKTVLGATRLRLF